MVRLDRTTSITLVAFVVAAASVIAACHDIDEPPPLPPLDPNAPLDAGADALPDGPMT